MPSPSHPPFPINPQPHTHAWPLCATSAPIADPLLSRSLSRPVAPAPLTFPFSYPARSSALSQALALLTPPSQAAWKLLGDVLMQHTAVTPLAETRALTAASPGVEAAKAAEAAQGARMATMRGARVAYCKALHLDPTQGESCGHVWTRVHAW